MAIRSSRIQKLKKLIQEQVNAAVEHALNHEAEPGKNTKKAAMDAAQRTTDFLEQEARRTAHWHECAQSGLKALAGAAEEAAGQCTECQEEAAGLRRIKEDLMKMEPGKALVILRKEAE